MANTSQLSDQTKLVVYFNDNEPVKMQTFKAFEAEEKKGTAIAGLTKRLLLKHIFGKYKVAIFYQNGIEVERWNSGIKN